MKLINIVLFFLLIFNSLIYAQNEPMPEENTEEYEQMRKEIEEIEKYNLELLKETDPEGYQQRLKVKERDEKINNIISQYKEKQISESTARHKLKPFIKEEINEQLGFIDYRIERLEKELNYWKQVKKNPYEFIDKRIDRYLGKTSPEDLTEEEFFW